MKTTEQNPILAAEREALDCVRVTLARAIHARAAQTSDSAQARCLYRASYMCDEAATLSDACYAAESARVNFQPTDDLWAICGAAIEATVPDRVASSRGFYARVVREWAR